MAEEITRINLSRLCFKGPMEELTQTVNLQPAMTVANLACLAILEKEVGNAAADVCAGHSLGEFSALHAAGIVIREDTMRLVLKRGELMHREARKLEGAMQAIVGLDIADSYGAGSGRSTKRGCVGGQSQHRPTNRYHRSTRGGSDGGCRSRRPGAKAVALKVSGAWHSELIRGAAGTHSPPFCKPPPLNHPNGRLYSTSLPTVARIRLKFEK